MQSQATTAANTHAYVKQDFLENIRVFKAAGHHLHVHHQTKKFQTELHKKYGNETVHAITTHTTNQHNHEFM